MAQEDSVGIEVRGHTSYNRKASQTLVSVAVFLDACVALLLALAAIAALRLSPRPAFFSLVLVAAIFLLYWLPQKRFLGMTLGQRIWRLKQRNERLYQCDHWSPASIFSSTLLTTIAVLGVVSSIRYSVLNHPIWLKASEWEMPVFVPPADWPVLPFYYTIGGWPARIAGSPVFYSVLYEKGPPARFVGHVTASWGTSTAGDTRLVIEGPKTPQGTNNREAIRECILNSPIRCLALRDAVLSRHVSEIQVIHPKVYELKWFRVNSKDLSSDLDEDEQTQGIYLSARGPTLNQTRFIVITPNGMQQAFILSYPNSPSNLAMETFQRAISSIRSFETLETPRTWVNQELGDIQLNEVTKNYTPEHLSQRLAEIQGLLISRISVIPSGFDSYFHLAGTSLLLAQNLAKVAKQGPSPGHASALRNAESAYRYSQDISPHDPRTRQIENIWIDLQKL